MDSAVFPPRAPPFPSTPLFAMGRQQQPPPPPPPPPPLPPSTSGIAAKRAGFRLVPPDAGAATGAAPSAAAATTNDDDTNSVYTVYKQRIDQMFEESDVQNAVVAASSPPPSPSNLVQQRIEQMFSDVAKSGVATAQQQMHHFSVDYLGAVALPERITSLAGLQTPLQQLYFSYRRCTTNSRQSFAAHLLISSRGLRIGGGDADLPDDVGDQQHQWYSYRTIAVWSAVKFVVNDAGEFAFVPLVTDPDTVDRRLLFQSFTAGEAARIVGVGEQTMHSPLFAVVMRRAGTQKLLECHGFVCQTSEDAIVMAATLYKSLMTYVEAASNRRRKPKTRHGITSMSMTSSVITCDTSTANQHPLRIGVTNKKQQPLPQQQQPVRPPRKKASTASSLASSSTNGGGDTNTDTQLLLDTQPLLLPNGMKQMKRRSVKTKPAPQVPLPPPPPVVAGSKEEAAALILMPYEEPIQPVLTYSDKVSSYMSKEQKLITAEIKQVISVGNNLKRASDTAQQQSESCSSTTNNNTSGSVTETGDILTKVTIPRSGSFLNAGGLTRYKSKISKSINGQVTGGSPLGFHELFNEFRLQEGLHSLDDILDAIIDANGMSFNDLKPIYKEFLLKLAVTLTKDELYHKSKAIMRRQRKRAATKLKLNKPKPKQTKKKMMMMVMMNMKNPKKKQKKQKKHRHRFYVRFPRLRRKSRRNATKRRLSGAVGERAQLLAADAPLDLDSASSSIDSRQFAPTRRRPPMTSSSSTGGGAQPKRMVTPTTTLAPTTTATATTTTTTTSEESDSFFSLHRRSGSTSVAQAHHRHSSSGYVSCSECSYDSDSCTCISADKCYCSLGGAGSGQVRSDARRRHAPLRATAEIYCGCDTDSCADSNKCYCHSVASSTQAPYNHEKKKQQQQQQKRKNFLMTAALSQGSDSSPVHTANNSCLLHSRTRRKRHQVASSKGNTTKVTTSLEYVRNPNSSDRYRRQQQQQLNLAAHTTATTSSMGLDYSLFSVPINSQQHLVDSGAVYAKVMSSTARRHQCERGRHALIGPFSGAPPTLPPPSANHQLRGGDDRKSAEIAALFADLSLGHHHHRHHHHASPPLGLRHQQQQLQPPQTLYCNAKNLFNSRSGLYTIQSQSDESTAMSGCGGGGDASNGRRLYYAQQQLQLQRRQQIGRHRSNLERSLGYLP